jgi:sialate O-acetylesterase
MGIIMITALFVTMIHVAHAIPDLNNGFSYASYYEDHMVLQIAPLKASVWGFAPLGDIGATVTVNITSTAMSTLTFTGIVQLGADHNQATWTVLFAPLAFMHPVTITAFLSNYKPIVLLDVIFGDVWICSGQSNMKLTVAQIFNASKVADEAVKYRDVIRFFSVGQVMSPKPLYDVTNIELHWTLPDEKTVLPFSAVCWLYAKNIYDRRQVPMGLIESAWGGTNIEVWSSAECLRQCHLNNTRRFKNTTELTENMDNSVLWNAMVHPLLNMTIYGVIWYQGESNAVYNRDIYNCTFPAMILDWRQKWFVATQGQTDLMFPFGFVQIGPTGAQPEIGGYCDIRWHQTVDVGYVPNYLMDNVFMAVSFDLTDVDVHYRDKETVSRRLSLAGLAVAYHIEVLRYQGPWLTMVVVDVLKHILSLQFDFNKYPVVIRNIAGFEVCCKVKASCDLDASDWLPAPVILPVSGSDYTQQSVQLNATLCSNMKFVSALRYGWRETPFPYLSAAVYSQINDLPTPPFVVFAPSHHQQQQQQVIWWRYVNSLNVIQQLL